MLSVKRPVPAEQMRSVITTAITVLGTLRLLIFFRHDRVFVGIRARSLILDPWWWFSKSCLTLSPPVGRSPPGFSVHGIA